MNRLYRIYLGSRNSDHHRFTTRDVQTVDRIMSRYFSAYTKIDALGVWEGVEEQTLILIVSTDRNTWTGEAGEDPIKGCARQLQATFKQFAVLLEDAGETILFT